MAVTVLLELKFKPEAVSAGRDLMRRTLETTRAFEGNLQTDVLVDEDDEAHWIIYEVWDTVEHDEAYRAFRAGEGKVTELPPLLAAPPAKTRYTTSECERLAQRGNHFAFEQLDAGAVVGGLGEIADRILATKVADLGDALDHLFRCARCPLRAAGEHGFGHLLGDVAGMRSSIRRCRSLTSASEVPTIALKFAERTMASKSVPTSRQCCASTVRLVLEGLELRREVGVLRVLCRDAQRHLLATAGDPERNAPVL